MELDLTKLGPGQKGIIVRIEGGSGLVNKLEHMGIRKGKTIEKVSSHFLRGPQTIRVGRTEVAIGFGMARKIFVEREDE